MTMPQEVELAELMSEAPTELVELPLLAESKSEQIVETTTNSSSGDSPFGGFIMGLLLIPFSISLLWMNERKMVNYAQTITDGQKECRSANPKEINEEDDKKLVHVQGVTDTNDTVADTDFAFEAKPKSIMIRRKVEMY